MTDSEMPNGSIEPQDKRVPMCRVSTAACVCFLLIIPAYGFGIIPEIFSGMDFLSVIALVLLFCFLATPIVAVAAKIRVAMSDGRLRGNNRASLALTASLALFVFAGIAMTSVLPLNYARRIICRGSLVNLSSMICDYADENGDTLPLEFKWCDVLSAMNDIDNAVFLCKASDGEKGCSSYAINREVLGVKFSELPKDMVLLFETENGWNQIAGPESVAIHHSGKAVKGLGIAYVDSEAEFIEIRTFEDVSKLEELKWYRDSTMVKASDYSKIDERLLSKPEFPYAAVLMIAGASIFFTVLVCRKFYAGKRLRFAGWLSLPAGAIGFVMGLWSETLYRPYFFENIGGYAGGILGVMSALCYVAVFAGLKERLNDCKSVRQLAVALGIAAGMICAGVLHLALMMIHRDNYFAIFAGVGFGAGAGAVLGVVVGDILARRCYKEEG